MYRPEKRVFRDDAFISVTRTLIESHFKVAGVELKSFPDDLHTKSMFFFGIKTAYIMQHTQHALVKTKYLSNKNLLNMIENKDTEKMQVFLTKVRKNIE